MYDRILVPLDGSKLAEAPLDYAVWLAQQSGAELHIIHVYQRKSAAQSRYLQEILTRVMHGHRYEAEKVIEARVATAIGDPANEILRYAEDNKVSLITMSTHGHTGIKRWLMGSVADKVVRYSNRPVRLVKSFPRGIYDTARYDTTVLALLDGSEMAEQVLPYAAYHAKLAGGTLILMSVCEPPVIIPAVSYHLIPPHEYPPKRPLRWEQYVEEETDLRKKECRLYLEKAAQLNEEGITKKLEAPSGEPVEEIITYLENNPVSLIAMTTRGRSGFSRWMLGSVAEKVLQASDSPVLIIRPEVHS